jgi:hypothetical protein
VQAQLSLRDTELAKEQAASAAQAEAAARQLRASEQARQEQQETLQAQLAEMGRVRGGGF